MVLPWVTVSGADGRGMLRVRWVEMHIGLKLDGTDSGDTSNLGNTPESGNGASRHRLSRDVRALNHLTDPS